MQNDANCWELCLQRHNTNSLALVKPTRSTTETKSSSPELSDKPTIRAELTQPTKFVGSGPSKSQLTEISHGKLLKLWNHCQYFCQFSLTSSKHTRTKQLLYKVLPSYLDGYLKGFPSETQHWMPPFLLDPPAANNPKIGQFFYKLVGF